MTLLTAAAILIVQGAAFARRPSPSAVIAIDRAIDTSPVPRGVSATGSRAPVETRHDRGMEQSPVSPTGPLTAGPDNGSPLSPFRGPSAGAAAVDADGDEDPGDRSDDRETVRPPVRDDSDPGEDADERGQESREDTHDSDEPDADEDRPESSRGDSEYRSEDEPAYGND